MRGRGTKWMALRLPLFVLLLLVLLVANTSIGAQLPFGSVNCEEDSTERAIQRGLPLRIRQSNFASVEKPVTEKFGRLNGFTEAILCRFHASNIFKSRDLLPTTVEKECVNKTVSTDFEDCKRKVQLRNGKFALMMSLVGLAFLFILGFTISGHMRQEKARRLTLLHVAVGEMSQQTSGVATPALKRIVEDDPEIGHNATTDVVDDIQSMRGEEVRQRTNLHMVPATFDGANDGWGIWIRANRENLPRIPRTVTSPPRPPPAPRIPTLKLPKPTLGTFHRVCRDFDFETGSERLQGEQGKSKDPSRLRWGSTV